MNILKYLREGDYFRLMFKDNETARKYGMNLNYLGKFTGQDLSRLHEPLKNDEVRLNICFNKPQNYEFKFVVPDEKFGECIELCNHECSITNKFIFTTEENHKKLSGKFPSYRLQGKLDGVKYDETFNAYPEIPENLEKWFLNIYHGESRIYKHRTNKKPTCKNYQEVIKYDGSKWFMIDEDTGPQISTVVKTSNVDLFKDWKKSKDGKSIYKSFCDTVKLDECLNVVTNEPSGWSVITYVGKAPNNGSKHDLPPVSETNYKHYRLAGDIEYYLY